MTELCLSFSFETDISDVLLIGEGDEKIKEETMFYDISHSTRRPAQYAKRYGTLQMWEDAEEESHPMYHLSGLDEPDLPVVTNESPDEISFLQWGFVPSTYAPQIKGKPIKTLNARNDRIFGDQSVYKESAISRRCLIMLDGFFDNYTKDGILFPFYFQMKSKSPFFVGGLWQTFVDPKDEVTEDTVTMVTCPANKEVAWVRGEKAGTPESRMPFIIDPKDDETWLHGTPEEAQKVIKSLPNGSLDFYTCQPIKAIKKMNREYMGNVPGILEKRIYPQLKGIIPES